MKCESWFMLPKDWPQKLRQNQKIATKTKKNKTKRIAKKLPTNLRLALFHTHVVFKAVILLFKIKMF